MVRISTKAYPTVNPPHSRNAKTLIPPLGLLHQPPLIRRHPTEVKHQLPLLARHVLAPEIAPRLLKQRARQQAPRMLRPGRLGLLACLDPRLRRGPHRLQQPHDPLALHLGAHGAVAGPARRLRAVGEQHVREARDGEPEVGGSAGGAPGVRQRGRGPAGAVAAVVVVVVGGDVELGETARGDVEARGEDEDVEGVVGAGSEAYAAGGDFGDGVGAEVGEGDVGKVEDVVVVLLEGYAFGTEGVGGGFRGEDGGFFGVNDAVADLVAPIGVDELVGFFVAVHIHIVGGPKCEAALAPEPVELLLPLFGCIIFRRAHDHAAIRPVPYFLAVGEEGFLFFQGLLLEFGVKRSLAHWHRHRGRLLEHRLFNISILSLQLLCRYITPSSQPSAR